MSAKPVTTPTSDELEIASGTRELPTVKVQLASTVGERIKWARERRDMTQKELARLTGKSRASVVQYEQNKISAPLDVIAEIADKLAVAPEFLAFGRTGIAGVKNAEEEVEVVEEMSSTGDKLTPTGGWAIPRKMFEDYEHRRTALKFVCLSTDEPNFNIIRGDRVVIDTHAVVNRSGLYVIQTAFGVRVVRIAAGIGAKDGLRVTSGGDGGEVVVDHGELEVIGFVVGTFHRTF